MLEQQAEYDYQRDIDLITSIDIVPSILEIICQSTGMGFAAVARVTEEKWIACAVLDKISFGLLPGSELVLETTICHEIRNVKQAVVIDHVAEDPVYSKHHTPAMYGFQSYISVPIFLKNGTFFGTLCAIDPKPADLKESGKLKFFELYADLIAFHFETKEQIQQVDARLKEEQRNTELREQFIAILGHDLKSPLSAVMGGAQILMKVLTEEGNIKIARIIKDSSLRMDGLIDNVLDFARGRLGGGINLNRNNIMIQDVLGKVIEECIIINPGRSIEYKIEVPFAINADDKRLSQLFSNLLGNAIKYGDPDQPVKIVAEITKENFIFSISNSCPKIPEPVQARLFQPFVKGDNMSGHQGLGLGLFIASEIARSHNGQIDVGSSEAETCFTFKMPL